MSRRRSWFSDDSYPERRPPRKAPEHGIKVGKLGTTWWGQRWIEALERASVAYAARLGRGRTYARAGRVHDLVVAPGGLVTAKVTGSSARPYTIEIRSTALSDTTWNGVLAALASEARFAATLLAGEMPKDIDDVFRRAGASLFADASSDLTTSCSCPDWANPCKHVAATHYVLGDALERDPFLLFELRGRTKFDVLAALRALRGGERTGSPPSPRVCKPKRRVGVSLGEIAASDYDRPVTPWPPLALSFEPVAKSGALLAQLGVPPSWRDALKPVEHLAPFVAAAAARARRIALAEENTVQDDG